MFLQHIRQYLKRFFYWFISIDTACVERWLTSHYENMEGTRPKCGLVISETPSSKNKYRLLHRKCDVRIFIHEFQSFRRVNKNVYKALSML